MEIKTILWDFFNLAWIVIVCKAQKFHNCLKFLYIIN
jgi:hypothetical protein